MLNDENDDENVRSITHKDPKKNALFPHFVFLRLQLPLLDNPSASPMSLLNAFFGGNPCDFFVSSLGGQCIGWLIRGYLSDSHRKNFGTPIAFDVRCDISD
jgi:hypothetical protein